MFFGVLSKKDFWIPWENGAFPNSFLKFWLGMGLDFYFINQQTWLKGHSSSAVIL